MTIGYLFFAQFQGFLTCKLLQINSLYRKTNLKWAYLFPGESLYMFFSLNLFEEFRVSLGFWDHFQFCLSKPEWPHLCHNECPHLLTFSTNRKLS